MARVFLSYRRADGRYAVGWIAERLGQLDEVSEVHTAFRDGQLRCGDDFPDALAEEIDSCDVLVAVIGPNWLGRKPEGVNRINDPGDWVGREITAAMAAGKRVLPVLVGGAQPLVEDELIETLKPLARLHSVTFDDGNDLENLVADLRSHLEEIDRARATMAGLEAPIVLPPVHFGAPVLALAVVAAMVGAVAGWLVTAQFTSGVELQPVFDQHDRPWMILTMVEFGLWAGLAVLGVHYFQQHFRGDIRIKWRPVLITYAFGGLLLGWAIVVFGASAPIRWDAQRTWLLAVIPIVLLAPWVISAAGTAWTRAVAQDHELGRRARVLGELGRASRLSVSVLGLCAVAAVLAAGSVDRALKECNASAAPDVCGETYQSHEIIALGILLAAIVTGVAVWGRSRLQQSSIALRKDLRDVAPSHRQHAEFHLTDENLDLGRWWQVSALAMPLAAALGVVIWI